MEQYESIGNCGAEHGDSNRFHTTAVTSLGVGVAAAGAVFGASTTAAAAVGAGIGAGASAGVSQLMSNATPENSYPRTIPEPESRSRVVDQSSNGRFTLITQSDGNLVVYQDGSPILTAILQARRSCRPDVCWASGTHGNPDAFLNMQDDGNLNIYRRGADQEIAGNALWASQ